MTNSWEGICHWKPGHELRKIDVNAKMEWSLLFTNFRRVCTLIFTNDLVNNLFHTNDTNELFIMHH